MDLRGLDIALLPLFRSTREQDDQHVAIPTEIHPISRAPIDTELKHAFANAFGVREIALFKSR